MIQKKEVPISERVSRIESTLYLCKSVLNFNEGVAFTGLSKSYLYKLTSTGGIPCYKPNHKLIYFKKDELESWLLRNKKATSAEIEAKAINFVANQKGGAK